MESASGMATAPGTDHLTAMPPELLHMIISYLFATHDPDKAFETAPLGKRDRHHLDRLAVTSKLLRGQVMDWSESFLRQHKDITKYKVPLTKRRSQKRNWLRGRGRGRGRGGLLSWSERYCVFCGKNSTRSAIFMNGLRCCKQCDERQWPDKMTKTAAKDEYHLDEHHLLPHQQRTSISAKMLAKHPGSAPKLRYGTIWSIGDPTTFFLRKDVEVLARYVHGDLETHLARGKVEREKLNETKAAKVEEARRLAQTLPRFGAMLPASHIGTTSHGSIWNSFIDPLLIDYDGYE